MKARYLMLGITAALIILLVVNSTSLVKKRGGNHISLPSLPMPIAKEYALITSAGQNTDVYIINDIANKLMIHNYFMPQAVGSDLGSVNTLVFVVGFSELGGKLQGTSFEDEKKRIAELLQKSQEKDLAVIAVYLGGRQQRGKETEELLKLICTETDYLICIKEANHDNFLSELARNSKIPITLINNVSSLSEPFASAFR